MKDIRNISVKSDDLSLNNSKIKKTKLTKSNRKLKVSSFYEFLNTLLSFEFLFGIIIGLVIVVFFNVYDSRNKEKISSLENIIKFNQEQFLEYDKRIEEQVKIIKSLKNDLDNKESIDDYFSKTMKNSINNFENISDTQKKKIIDNIFKFSEKYNINPVLVYAIIETESSFRPYLEHKRTYIPSLKKHIQAVGLGGIVWEFWKEDLKNNKIAYSRQDLFEIENNVEAICYILDVYRNYEKLPQAKNITESMLMRFYGSAFAKYENNVYNKIALLLTKDF
jgi:hypothetical protein|nr:MAG TPA: hypothetical protein [Caudoviricetes sp.]DAX61710.1 MAG TPA: hypothetical protein [Caudoviricetes sp.]